MIEAEELRLQQLIRKEKKVALNSLELLELLRLSGKKKAEEQEGPTEVRLVPVFDLISRG